MKRFVMVIASVLVPLALCAEPAFASKMVALTFDDGPSRNTNAVVEILRAHEASATFFFVGSRMTKGKFDAEALLSVGEMANHSYRHSAAHPWKKITYSKAAKEILDTNARIRSYTGRDPIWFRSMSLARSKTTDRAIRDTKMRFVGGVLISDWGRGSGNKASSIKSRVINKAAKNHSVPILHETNSQTIKALPGIIDWYHSHGYQVVTVSKLMDSN